MLTLKPGHRFPVPDWEQQYELTRDLGTDIQRLDAFWTDRGREWVRLLRDNFGGQYCVEESKNFWVITARDQRTRLRLVQWAEAAYERIRTAVGQLPGPSYGKTPMLVFEDQDLYYAYLSEYVADGHHPASGGVFLNQGYGHLAFWFGDWDSAEAVVAHEIAHSVVANLDLPLWLNEGIAQVAEVAITGRYGPEANLFGDDQAMPEVPEPYWNSRTIQEFWSGTGFDIVGDDQSRHYGLSFLLVHRLAANRARFQAMLKEVTSSDAGRAAIRSAYGIDLDDLVVEVLGEDDWASEGPVVV